ncbi:MAG: large subunit ribosomal protein, partial [Gaiellales bacterium]|nr:large subunit ribosomal protein [Gaiellales bacterium]
MPVPAGVDITVEPGRVSVKGPRGQLEQVVSHDMSITQDGDTLTVTRPTDRGPHRAL